MKRPLFSLLFSTFLFYSASYAAELNEIMQEIKTPTRVDRILYPQDFQYALPITSTTNHTLATKTFAGNIPSIILTVCIIGAIFVHPIDVQPNKKKKYKRSDYPNPPKQKIVPKNTYRYQYKQRHHTPTHSSYGR